MAHQWRGVLREYADRLDVTDATPIVTLGEGGTPLIPAPALSRRTGAKVWVKFEGMNPTGSFKDRGMTMAVSKAVEHGAKAVICASTGNTSASAAAYAAHAGITAAVLVPEGKIAMGKLSPGGRPQRRAAAGAAATSTTASTSPASSPTHYPVHLVNSVNNDRIEGQKTAAFEVVEVLGDAPDFHFIPVGNAGNYTAYSRGYREEAARGVATRSARACSASRPRAARRSCSARSSRTPRRSPARSASATRPRGSSRSTARDDDRRLLRRDRRRPKILEAHRILLARGRHLRRARLRDQRRRAARARRGRRRSRRARRVVLTVTGHGLKDPQWALRTADGSRGRRRRSSPIDVAEIAERARARARVRAAHDRVQRRRRRAVGRTVTVRVPATTREPRPGLRHARPRAVASTTS